MRAQDLIYSNNFKNSWRRSLKKNKKPRKDDGVKNGRNHVLGKSSSGHFTHETEGPRPVILRSLIGRKDDTAQVHFTLEGEGPRVQRKYHGRKVLMDSYIYIQVSISVTPISVIMSYMLRKFYSLTKTRLVRLVSVMC